MPPTLRQIAEQASLDVSTVSRVLNRPDQARVCLQTRRKVEDLARDMGYQAHGGAQSLARGRTGCVGILVPDLQSPVMGRYVALLNRLLHEQNRRALPFPTGWSPGDELEALETLGRRQVDAVINLHYQPENLEAYRRLREQDHPLVFRVADRQIDDLPVDGVGIDISDAFQRLIHHLIDRGYRKVGLVGGLVSDELAAGRRNHPGVEYVLAAHEEAGLTFDPRRVIPCPENTAEDACVAVTSILRDHPERFDALILQSSDFLPGVWHALREQGMSIPERMAVAAVSDTELCRLMDVPVTVWDQPIERICRGLAHIVDQRLAGERERIKIQYASRLIERGSTRGRVERDGPR